MLPSLLLGSSIFAGLAASYDTLLQFNGAPTVENRTIDEIYDAALKEGGVVTLFAGGDEKTQQNGLKTAFETRFPGMTLNVTVDVSKYHDGNIDRQLVNNNVFVDSVILQTLHDFPRWDHEGALLHYQPLNFQKIHPGFRDVRAAWYGVNIIGWTFIWNSNKIANGSEPKEFTDFLKPEFKDKLVLTYPNDDDAVLYAFDLILNHYGYSWFEALLAQNPRWVRGTATPGAFIRQANSSLAATFTSSTGLNPAAPIRIGIPSEAPFVTWAQRAAILRDAPHPEGAKLLHNFMLSDERQSGGGWSVLKDVPAPSGFPAIMDVPTTNPVEFERFMGDRVRVERLKLWFEDKIGTPQGLSPLIDAF
ncbi:ABC transporter [Paraphoma chrysanthemicola]|uniref:ABC transporter n=1 Tax=Paraphoma chrysanthemicola TaxID=798071 RepID=A0A8K0R8Y5_9PLEO|nr:ABC transporter [Paraphoma chrysanthemicola]